MSVVEKFFYILNTIKLYHWQTLSYARHKYSDELYNHLAKRMDEFVETYSGIYGRPSSDSFSLEIVTYDDDSIVDFLKEICTYLTTDLQDDIKDNPDLLHIRDELLEHVNHAFYDFDQS